MGNQHNRDLPTDTGNRSPLALRDSARHNTSGTITQTITSYPNTLTIWLWRYLLASILGKPSFPSCFH
jgi:hypothetical protein